MGSRFTVGADGVRPVKPTRIGRGRGRLLFGYTELVDPDVPSCTVCGARYALLESRDPDQPLECHLVCWCGAALPVTFDDLLERQAFVAVHLGLPSSP
jgi:uncharacterized protein (DUF983 family)